MRSERRWKPFCAMLGLLMLVACGGGGGGSEPPRISIANPTSETTYATDGASVIVGGSISGASFVHARNATTGNTTEGYVNYLDGLGSWFADALPLVPGDNEIVVTADADGTGRRTASATLTVSRPLQPATLVINGAAPPSATTYWVDMSSVGGHQLALFGDGTGRSTTGSVLTEAPGPATDIVWTYDGPDAIRITGCPTCSFQRISRISGSLASGGFYGQVETVAGAGEVALHFFQRTAGSL